MASSAHISRFAYHVLLSYLCSGSKQLLVGVVVGRSAPMPIAFSLLHDLHISFFLQRHINSLFCFWKSVETPLDFIRPLDSFSRLHGVVEVQVGHLTARP
jgi:hypothetical protein